MSKVNQGNPPKNARRVERWRDLPRASLKGANFTIANEGQEPFAITVSRHCEQVLRGLARYPLYAASICRLSRNVEMLRGEGVHIETDWYAADRQTDRCRYGIYRLVSKVSEVVQ